MNEPLSFVRLRYLPTPADPASGVPLLVLMCATGIEVIIRSGWEIGLEAGDHRYLEDLMAEWCQTEPEDVPQLLQELSELSIGPLLAVEYGGLNSELRSVLIAQILSN